MTDEQLYEFDLNGFLILKGVIPPEDLGRYRSVLRAVQPSAKSGKFSFFDLDPCFMDLMAEPVVLGVLKALLGEWLRFDHAFGIRMARELDVLDNLHAGPLENQRAFFYQFAVGRLHNGLIKVIHTLSDVRAGDGGFICVPGSHKSNFPCRIRHDSHLVVNPAMRAGDTLVFTEALVHGSRQWTPSEGRTALVYSYAPGCLAWRNYDTIEPYLALARTDLQRDLLRPPFVGDYDEKQAVPHGPWPRGRRSPVAFDPPRS
jgi:hypothetical protein